MKRPIGSFDRREFMGFVASGVSMAFLPFSSSAVSLRDRDSKVLFHTRFAPGDPELKLTGQTMVTKGARHGQCVGGEINKKNAHRQIDVPLKNMANRTCELELWLRSEKGSRCAIWACELTPAGGGKPARISAPRVNSNSPDIAFTANGDAFAAWDSFRNDACNLCGAWFRNGRWESEKRLTAADRLERHVRIATHGNDVWLAWQAQAFQNHTVNGIREQRIAVAKMTGKGLAMPEGMFGKVSPRGTFLLRPVPCFDPAGRLWVTVRESMGLHHGWLPLAWCYSGQQWTGPFELWADQGRWRPVDLSWTADGNAVAAIQRDDLPKS